MTTASHTTAAVVETNVPAPLHAHLEDVSSRYIRFTARIKVIFSSFFDRQVPLGYEDQTGFHYGEKPTLSDSRFENRSR